MRRAAPLLLLAALMAAGCGVHAVTPHAPAPTTAVQPPPSIAITALPPALQGSWQPVSKALEGPGPLKLTAQTLTWAPCGAVARAVNGTTTGTAVLLTLPGTTACRLDGTPITHLRAQTRADNACELELSIYQNAAQLAKQERLAWGVYTRQGCAPN